jgi:hypothetical protein
VEVFLGALCPIGRAIPIYENILPNGTGAFTALEIGDEVYAAGTAREVTQIQVGLSMQGYTGSAGFVLRIYDNTGANGAPGALLWQSAFLQNVSIAASPQLVSFNVPDILVPNVFTWTLQGFNETPVAVEYDAASSPSIGGNPSYSWFGGPGQWTQSPDTVYMSQVDAETVPDKLNAGLAGLGIFGFILGGRAWLRYSSPGARR